jgi:hypothetical protein
MVEQVLEEVWAVGQFMVQSHDHPFQADFGVNLG